jgi:hypothetical protein
MSNPPPGAAPGVVNSRASPVEVSGAAIAAAQCSSHRFKYFCANKFSASESGGPPGTFSVIRQQQVFCSAI